MIGAREFNLSRSGVRSWRIALAVAVALASGTIGCSTLAMKTAKSGAQSPAAKGNGESSAPPLGVERPKEVARASLGTLSASKWRFGNGLLAVLMPDATATSVAYTTWFRVGSRDEDEAAGQTGLAHLFEHLMFTQTKGQPLGEFDRAIEAVGGSSNAMTYYDFTAYIDSVPPGELARIMRMEADRMVNLALDKRQVDNERDVVVEERLASVEDNVDGILDEVMYKQSFHTHPYRWPVMGWMKDIKAVTPAKATAFYRRFYNPANAIVVVAGRIDEAATLDALLLAYGGLAAVPESPRTAAQPEHAPAEEVRATLVRPVPADRLVVGYPSPGLADADRAAYEIANEILLGGPSSRIYKRLVVEREMASSARGDISPTRDPGLYGIWVQLTKGHTAAEAEAVIVDEIAALAKTPIPAAELDKAKARLETEFWRELTSSHGRAEMLGQFEIACGDFRRMFARGDEYARVSAADVRAIATRYLVGPRSVVVATPPGPSPAGGVGGQRPAKGPVSKNRS
jgi:zinc protease